MLNLYKKKKPTKATPKRGTAAKYGRDAKTGKVIPITKKVASSKKVYRIVKAKGKAAQHLTKAQYMKYKGTSKAKGKPKIHVVKGKK